MFKRLVSNIDLYNKISHLDNKLDIILAKMNEGTVSACCDCKYNENIVYEQMKWYIEDKFTTLQDSLISKVAHVDVNVHILRNVFEDYRNDMINNLQLIINNSMPLQERQLTNFKSELDELESRVKEALNNVTSSISKCDELFESIYNLDATNPEK